MASFFRALTGGSSSSSSPSSSSSSSSSFSSSSSSVGDPREQVRTWTRQLEKEKRQLGREQERARREELKIMAELKKAAKAGHTTAMKTYAKTIAVSRAHQERLLLSQTQINSAVLSMKTMGAEVRVAGHMQKSTDVLKSMNELVRIPQLRQVATDMSREMMRMGVLDEMIEEAFAQTDSEDVEEVADAEVEKVMKEILQEQFDKVGPMRRRTVATSQQDEDVEDEAVREEERKLQARVQQL